jgi:hypothetical protein
MKFSELEINKVYRVLRIAKYEGENGEISTEREMLFGCLENDRFVGGTFYKTKNGITLDSTSWLDEEIFDAECSNCVEVWNGDFEK